MPSIIEMRQQLADLNNDLEKLTKKGLEMAMDPKTDLEALQAQSDEIDKLQVRMALVMMHQIFT